ncbi:TPA: hypothetical protein PRY54_003921 [Escherichia coli]|uniref:PapB/FocB family fimbrial expression transcriptional regulator n=1 Tax=Salmonella enterica TaxID=28901 RepID=UPI0009ABBB96|nr:PapB/FocB family fimbrial expression transcriptional regulator [Salmonella enterica]EBW7049973.1 hypothetical protein [Salmonella enterica subsp. enterica serovar Muenchen]ECI7782062.1 hypothetical protein [Salmonella enterica subsp. enterica]EDV7203874.1 hypothetical protein [Salmonella enterica subsp. enterica serovar Bredeney]MBS9213438.1 hypothetical protein [Escherichia coli]EBI8251249.1 hypothetical protein [Salmonella enterica]
MGSLGKDEYLFREKPGHLMKGMVHKEHFRLLVEVSNIRSAKVILALEKYLVFGTSIKSLCAEYGITSSYFNTALRRMQEISCCIAFMVPFYR